MVPSGAFDNSRCGTGIKPPAAMRQLLQQCGKWPARRTRVPIHPVDPKATLAPGFACLDLGFVMSSYPTQSTFLMMKAGDTR
jgi:hypothetical protein